MYVIIYEDTECPVGPFSTRAEAQAWHDENMADDGREYTIVQLTKPY